MFFFSNFMQVKMCLIGIMIQTIKKQTKNRFKMLFVFDMFHDIKMIQINTV